MPQNKFVSGSPSRRSSCKSSTLSSSESCATEKSSSVAKLIRIFESKPDGNGRSDSVEVSGVLRETGTQLDATRTKSATKRPEVECSSSTVSPKQNGSNTSGRVDVSSSDTHVGIQRRDSLFASMKARFERSISSPPRSPRSSSCREKRRSSETTLETSLKMASSKSAGDGLTILGSDCQATLTLERLVSSDPAEGSAQLDTSVEYEKLDQDSNSNPEDRILQPDSSSRVNNNYSSREHQSFDKQSKTQGGESLQNDIHPGKLERDNDDNLTTAYVSTNALSRRSWETELQDISQENGAEEVVPEGPSCVRSSQPASSKSDSAATNAFESLSQLKSQSCIDRGAVENIPRRAEGDFNSTPSLNPYAVPFVPAGPLRELNARDIPFSESSHSQKVTFNPNARTFNPTSRATNLNPNAPVFFPATPLKPKLPSVRSELVQRHDSTSQRAYRAQTRRPPTENRQLVR